MKPAILRQSPATPRVIPRLRIVDRYLLREISAGFLAATVILLLVMLGGTLADLLTKIARGRIPAELLFTLLGLRTAAALTILMPLAVLVGVLLACGRLWRESEMAVLQSSGIGPAALLRPLAMFLLPTAFLLGVISFWLGLAAAVLLIGGTAFEIPDAAQIALAIGAVAGFFGLVAIIAGIGRVAGFFGIIAALVGNVYVLSWLGENVF